MSQYLEFLRYYIPILSNRYPYMYYIPILSNRYAYMCSKSVCIYVLHSNATQNRGAYVYYVPLKLQIGVCICTTFQRTQNRSTKKYCVPMKRQIKMRTSTTFRCNSKSRCSHTLYSDALPNRYAYMHYHPIQLEIGIRMNYIPMLFQIGIHMCTLFRCNSESLCVRELHSDITANPVHRSNFTHGSYYPIKNKCFYSKQLYHWKIHALEIYSFNSIKLNG